MNCKEGDLAMIVVADGDDRDLGKVVRIVEPGEDWAHLNDTRFHWAVDTLGQRMWCKNPGVYSDGKELIDIPDAELRPIRDSDGQDEMLRIAGLPKTKENVL